MGRSVKVYNKQGGNEMVVASGGLVTVESGGNVKVASGATLRVQGFMPRAQVVPTAKTTAVTLTIAELLTGMITATHAAGATAAYTLPTGALVDAGCTLDVGDSFDWVLINLSANAVDTVTVTAGNAHTIVGNAIVQSAHASTGLLYGYSAQFRTKKTAADTMVTYRIA